MRISSLKVKDFRRFVDLEIRHIPKTAKLVVLTGPNGSGKSSLFDAMLLRYRLDANFGWSGDLKYYDRPVDRAIYLGPSFPDMGARIQIKTHDGASLPRGSLYIRTAYRNDHEFAIRSLNQQQDILSNQRLNRMIEPDATVAENYQRLASQAMEDVFVREDANTTIGAYRDKMIGEVREPLKRLFNDLSFVGVGNPLVDGSFRFDKGQSKGFDYKNLSGGEKAAFDLILDLVVKRRSFPDAIYCVDEPETHMNTKLQGALLAELVDLLPGESQLWIASHSVGMMRRAKEMHDANPESVAFIDFADRDFDRPVVLSPSQPTRVFWQGVMHVALDDLASLVVPSQVVICEGNPSGAIPGKNADHDAKVYGKIFAAEMSETMFISGGSSREIKQDFIGLATILPKIAPGITVSRLIDRDDHGQAEIDEFLTQGVRMLSRRNLECFLYDDEVLIALCDWAGKPEKAQELLAAKQGYLAQSEEKGYPADDLKKWAGSIYNEAKRLLALTAVGSDALAFARETLAPLVTSEMNVYAELKRDIFLQ